MALLILISGVASAQQLCRNANGVDVLCTNLGAAVSTACRQAVDAADLSRLTNLTTYAGCKDDTACTMKRVGLQVAAEKRLPADLVLAMLWTESRWNQWDDLGDVIVGGGVDFGAGQLNITTHRRNYDWSQVEGDILYNTRASGDVLQWSYNYSRRQSGRSGEDLLRATYGVYNAGPRGATRPFVRNDPRDANFLRHLRAKPWRALVGGC